MLNARHSVEELNFDCGHELIHLTKHRGLGLSSFHCFDTLKPKQDPFIEWEANEGAAELTVPYRSFLPLLSDAILSSAPGRIWTFSAIAWRVDIR